MMKPTVERNAILPCVVAGLTLLSLLAAPALFAAPQADDTPQFRAIFDPGEWLGYWFDDMTTGLESMWRRSGCTIDPNGGACVNDLAAPRTTKESPPDAEARTVREQ